MTAPIPGPDSNTPAALSIDDFTRRYGVGRTLAYRELKEGRLRAFKVGKRTLIRKADADAWLASLDAYASPAD